MTTPYLVLPGAGLIAFGDSFTDAKVPAGVIGYARVFTTHLGGTLTNYGLGSSLSTYSARIALAKLTDGSRRQTISWLSGLNDVRGKGAPAIPKVIANIRAFIVTSLLKTSAPASSLVKSGPWKALSTAYGGRAPFIKGTGLSVTGSLTARLSWTFYGDNVVIGTFRTNNISTKFQNFEVSIDGGAWEAVEVLGLTVDNYSYDVYVKRGLSSGRHLLEIRPTSLLLTAIDYVGVLDTPQTKAPVIIGQIPHLLNYPQYNSIATVEIVDAANVAIETALDEFSDFEVRLARTNNFYDPTVTRPPDGIHPPTAGQRKIYEAFAAQISL